MNTSYHCDIENRRQAVLDSQKAINGIDYLEVDPATQQKLMSPQWEPMDEA